MFAASRDRSRSPPRAQGVVPSNNGDWFCEKCGDLNFRRNIVYRNCGANKPDDPSRCGPPDAATFLKDHIIDDQVLGRFLSLTSDQQLVVIMRGTLSGSRDPSAVLSSRISQVLSGSMTAANPSPRANPQPHAAAPLMTMMMQMMAQMTGQIPGMKGCGKGPIYPRSGDWFCQQCGDHQFAKNAVCRSCGAPRPTDGTECLPPSPEKFIAMHPGLEEHAIAKFYALDSASQTIVIKRGSLIGSRDSSNPTGILLGRIKTVQQQAMAGGVPMGGMQAMPMGGAGASPQQGGMQQMQMMQQMMQMMQQTSQQQQQQQQPQPLQQQQQFVGMQQMQQPVQQMQQPMHHMQQPLPQMQQPLDGMQQMMQQHEPQLDMITLGGANDTMAILHSQQQAQSNQGQIAGEPQLL